MTETYGELSRLFGDYYALSVTQLFAFSDKHAAFERNGNMSLFEKFELAREVSEICDSVVPLIKVVIVEGGKRGDAATADDDDMARALTATGQPRSCRTGCHWDERQTSGGGRKSSTAVHWQQQQRQTRERRTNPFGAIMDDDVDRTVRKNNKRENAVADKYIELKVYSRSVNYFHESVDVALTDDDFGLGRRLSLTVPVV